MALLRPFFFTPYERFAKRLGVLRIYFRVLLKHSIRIMNVYFPNSSLICPHIFTPIFFLSVLHYRWQKERLASILDAQNTR